LLPLLKQGRHSQSLGPPSVQPEVAGCGVVEHEEVQLVELVKLDLLLGADIAEELGCHGICGAGGLGVTREAQGVADAHQPQHVVGVLFQRLVLAHQVVVDVTRVTQLVGCLPVLVERAVALRRRVYQVLGEFFEFDVGAVEQGVLRGVLAVPADDAGAKTLVEGRVVLEGELVAVCRDQSLERLADEEELEVVLEPVVNLSDGVLVQCLQVGRDVGFIGRDVHWVTVEERKNPICIY